MSLLPLLFSAWWADLDRPHRIFDQNFGMGLFPEQLLLPSSIDRLYSSLGNRGTLDSYYRPLNELLRRGDTGASTITADKDTFKVILDVQQFKPEEIGVKLVDRSVVVEGKHEEKKDEHGLISRQFVRKYFLPDQVDADQLASSISSDGILTIMAPLKEKAEKSNEKTIKIEFTGKPAIRPSKEGSATTTSTEEASTTGTESREDATTNPTQEKPEK